MLDHQFPRFHVRPPTGYVNDPNGPLFVDGRYHLYFQYVYDTPRRGPVVWGHASSADLASWHLHRPALSPHPQSQDRDGCWSGNTVAVGTEIVAFYSGSRAGTPYQSVLAATSTDGGSSFGAPRPVIDDPAPDEGVVEFRDPFVWREPDDTWAMVVGSGGRDGGDARLYVSTDLQDWKHLGPYVAGLPDADRDVELHKIWECPQVLSSGDRDALLISTMRAGGQPIGRVVALTGPRIDGRLAVERVHYVDDGQNFYAASVLRDPGIVWGWVTEGRAPERCVEVDWSGMLSLPRVATILDDGRLGLAPVPALTALRTGEASPDALPAQFEAEIVLGPEPRLTVTLAFGDEEHLELSVDRETGRVTIDRSEASVDPLADRDAAEFTDAGLAEGEVLRWYVDGSVSELFTPGGYCATTRFYPVAAPPWRLEVSDAASVRLYSLSEM